MTATSARPVTASVDAAVVADPRRRVDDLPGLWRSVDVYRVLALGYAIALFVPVQADYRHPWGAWAVLGVMTGWTVFHVVLGLTGGRRGATSVLTADLVLTTVCVLSTRLLDAPERVASGAATLPSLWAAAPVASFAVGRGWRLGGAAALVVAAADVVEVWPHVSAGTVDSIVQLILVGTVVGYNVELYTQSRRELVRATAVEAAARERERLAADIHDSVLQVLAYVQRRGAEVGGEAAAIGRLAGEQEARLRAMVASGPPTDDPVGGTGAVDVRALLAGLSRSDVTVTGPAGPVVLPGDVGAAVVAATQAALDNVTRHAGPGARAFVLVEDEADVVTVTVRDDGAGIAPGRLEAAAAEGRLGVSAAIRRRIAEVGGTVEITGGPGLGTEVEMRVPRGRVR